jgi:mannose-1-phosphate guanylyltransferase / phosphomannomutase
MKAVIMAGGFGTRIQPLTASVPKPMLQVLNVPMVEHILQRVKEVRITEIVILLFFKPEVIKKHFKEGKKWGVNISYITPDSDFGTAGAVGQAREILQGEPFIIISGDLVTDFDLKKIIAFHEAKKSLLTITLTPVENPLQFGVVITDENGQIVRFLEKPSWGEVFSDTINTGIYVLEPEILEYIPQSGAYDFSKDLFPALMQDEVKLWGCKIEGYWRDVGNPQSYRDVHKDILGGAIQFDLPGKLVRYESGNLYTKTDHLPANLTVVGNVVIGKNVEIGYGVTLEQSCIADNVEISENSILKRCVVWDGVSIGSNNEIYDSVICNDVKIRNSVEIKKGAIIAENVKILSKVEIRKDITVWPDKKIEKGAIVSRNVVWGESFKANIFNKGKVVGVANLELTGEVADKLAEAFASIFPVGSSIYLSRDYHQASGMIKRFVVGGVLAVGVNALDLSSVPANVMRHRLLSDENAAGGIHVRQSIDDPYKTEISFYTSEAMPIDSKITDAVQRIYFREQFRRVEFSQIGSIVRVTKSKEKYIKDVEALVGECVSEKEPHIAVDLMYGMTSDIFPQMLNKFNVESVMLNGYASQDKLLELSTHLHQSRQSLSNIVTSLSLDLGILLYPDGQKAEYIDESGALIEDHCLLLVLILLLERDAKKIKVYLPAWAPDFLDTTLQYVEITRGKLMGKKSDFLDHFELIADTNGSFAFTEFSLNSDAIYCSFKVLQMLFNHNLTLKQIRESVPTFFYHHTKIEVQTNKKGTIMRMLLEDSKNKKSDHDDGIKIYESDTDWLLMVPDDFDDFVHLYIQSESKEVGEKMLKNFRSKIKKWSS